MAQNDGLGERTMAEDPEADLQDVARVEYACPCGSTTFVVVTISTHAERIHSKGEWGGTDVDEQDTDLATVECKCEECGEPVPDDIVDDWTGWPPTPGITAAIQELADRLSGRILQVKES